MRARDCSLPQFFVPQALDTLLQDLNAADEVINQVDPNLSKWLGETANVSGGGAKGMSDRFVAGFLYVWLWKFQVNYALFDNKKKEILSRFALGSLRTNEMTERNLL